jgi:hypothetical protein
MFYTVVMSSRTGVLASLVCLALLVAPSLADDSDAVIIKSRDGDMQLALPTGWDSITPDKPQIAAENPAKHEQVEVFTASHSDIHNTLRNYAQSECDAFARNFTETTISSPDEVQFGANNAVRYEIHGTLKTNESKTGLVLTVVDLDRHFASVLSYCPESNFSDNEADLQDVPRGLSEVYSGGN